MQLQPPSCQGLQRRQQTGRVVQGAAALLLPFMESGRPDLDAWQTQLDRVIAAGLVPAVNMDTGYVQMLEDAQQTAILELAGAQCRGRSFICGAPVTSGDGDLAARYRRRIDAILAVGGTPIVFPGPEMRALDEAGVVALHAAITRDRTGVLAFELGEAFVPWGRIYRLDTVAGLMALPGLVGMKHSSLDRRFEWARLDCRDRVRPEFRLMTGNDLAIDMIMYGSDYLLGLAAFHPEAFAQRDSWWAEGDARFFELNDALQALGAFAFRPPVPAYKHSAAQMLTLRKVIPRSQPPPGAPRRPDSDLVILETLLARIEAALQAPRELPL